MMKANSFKILSILIPVYNEEKTIDILLKKLIDVKLINDIQKEIIIINDASSDQSEKEIETFISDHPEIGIIYHCNDRNQGKGACLHTGISLSKGEYIIVQDADLEYDPLEYNDLLSPILSGHADVVYGSRFSGGKPQRMLFFWHSVGNRLLTVLCNMFSNLNLSDMECGYKVVKSEYLKSLNLREKRFGFEPEVTIKLSRISHIRIYEVAVSYYGRTYSEGKKINYKDGFRAIYCILRYGFFK
jgi:glycosyltransferase involved in cell wall biosynthesis